MQRTDKDVSMEKDGQRPKLPIITMERHVSKRERHA